MTYEHVKRMPPNAVSGKWIPSRPCLTLLMLLSGPKLLRIKRSLLVGMLVRLLTLLRLLPSADACHHSTAFADDSAAKSIQAKDEAIAAAAQARDTADNLSRLPDRWYFESVTDNTIAEIDKLWDDVNNDIQKSFLDYDTHIGKQFDDLSRRLTNLPTRSDIRSMIMNAQACPPPSEVSRGTTQRQFPSGGNTASAFGSCLQHSDQSTQQSQDKGPEYIAGGNRDASSILSGTSQSDTRTQDDNHVQASESATNTIINGVIDRRRGKVPASEKLPWSVMNGARQHDDPNLYEQNQRGTAGHDQSYGSYRPRNSAVPASGCGGDGDGGDGGNSGPATTNDKGDTGPTFQPLSPLQQLLITGDMSEKAKRWLSGGSNGSLEVGVKSLQPEICFELGIPLQAANRVFEAHQHISRVFYGESSAKYPLTAGPYTTSAMDL